jgi:hypothetical protein
MTRSISAIDTTSLFTTLLDEATEEEDEEQEGETFSVHSTLGADEARYGFDSAETCSGSLLGGGAGGGVEYSNPEPLGKSSITGSLLF